MKILILASNPRKDLNLEEEIRHLQGTIERSRNREDLVVEVGFAVRPEDLQGLLLRHEPEIVHFCGHGTGKQGLVLQEDHQIEKLVSTDALSNLFDLCSRWVKCVLLNACYSEVQADAIVQHIDYAIGMSHEIRDDAAIAFSTGFYQALGYGQSIEQSYKFGCNAIQLHISENSTFRSVMTEEKRKLEVAKTVESVVIPEHLKPVLRKKKNVTTVANSYTAKPSANFASSSKLDLQSHIDKVLETEIGLRLSNSEFKEHLANNNVRLNSDASSPKKTRKFFIGGTFTVLALTLSFSLFSYTSPSKQNIANNSSNSAENASLSADTSADTTEMTAKDYFYSGLDEYKQDNYQKAIADYTQAIEIDPNYADAYYKRGNAYHKLEENQKALADYNRAIEIEPNDPGAYFSRGNAYRKLEENQKALADYTQAIKIDPNYSYAYYNRGNAYRRLEEYQKALENYQKAAQLYQQEGNTEYYQDALNQVEKLQLRSK